MDMKLRQKEQLKAEYTHITEKQLEEGIVERILRERVQISVGNPIMGNGPD